MAGEIKQSLIKPTKFPFDPAKVKTVITLLAVMAGILWAISLTWLIIADSAEERIFVGIVTSILFIFILLTITYLSRFSPDVIKSTMHTQEDVSEFIRSIAQSHGIPETEIRQKIEKSIIGNDRDYLIKDPRPDWVVRWTSISELIKEDSSIVEDDLISEIEKRQPGADFKSDNILEIKSNTRYKIDLDLSASKVNGVTALYMHHAPVRAHLVIIPWPKYCTIRGTHDTIISFAIDKLSGIIEQGYFVKTLQILQRADGWQSVIAETEEVLEDVIVNGIEHQNIKVKNSVVCRESSAMYYALIWSYPEGSAIIQSDIEQLREIVDSFQLVTPIDPQKETKKILENAQQIWIGWIKKILSNSLIMHLEC